MILRRISKFFSSNKKKEKKTTKRDVAVGGAVAITAGPLSYIGGQQSNVTAFENYKNAKITAKDSKKIGNKLLLRAHKNGIPIYLNPRMPDCYGHGRINGKFYEEINLSSKDVDPATIAHEVGHSEHYRGRTGSKVGKAAHTVDNALSRRVKGKPLQDRITKSIRGNTALAGVGFANGLNAERKKQRGEKRSIYNNIGSAVIPLAIVSPKVMKEAAASKKAVKMMKELGASKELIDQSKVKLGHALDTYKTTASIPVISSVLGDVSGRAYGKLSKKGKKEKKKS